MSRTKVEKKEVPDREDLSGIISSAVNDRFKKKGSNLKTAFLLTDPEITSDISDFISTGSTLLDLAISNRPNGGIPLGRIIEIFGMEASGKSLLAASIAANVQKKGGIAVYYDTEAAISKEFFEALGIDLEKFVYIPMNDLEDIFDSVESVIETVRTSDRDKNVVIIIDSIMGSSTKKELESNYERDGWNTDKAILLSKAMRKITNLLAYQKVALVLTNQLRSKLGVTFGEQWTTSGGKAVPFASSVRIKLKSMGKITVPLDGKKQVVGIQTRAEIVKNRVGPPFKAVDYDIYFDSGIDDYGSWLAILKEYKYANNSGAWYSFSVDYSSEIVNPNTGELKLVKDYKFTSKDFASVLEANPEFTQYLYGLICDKFIMKYRINKDYGIDDITVDEEDSENIEE